MKAIRLIEIGGESSSKPKLVSFLRACGRLTSLFLALFLFLAIPVLAAAASDGALDPSFSNFTGVSKLPLIYGKADWTTSGTANGNSLINGYFTSISIGGTPTSVNSLAKIYYNGSTNTTTIDSSFHFPIDGEVRGVRLANPENPTSDIIIWGSFSLSAGGKTWYNLARLRNSGSGYAVDDTFPVVFNPGGYVRAVTPFGTYNLVGGFNMQVPGDTTRAYHLIRLKAGFIYDGDYTRSLSRPGGCVTGIGMYTSNNINYPRIYGTLPQADGSYHWWEALDSDMVTLQKSFGTNPTSGSNYGPIDGPIFNLAQINGGPYIIVGNFKNAFGMALSRVAQLNSSLTGLDNTTNNFNASISSLGGASRSTDQIFITPGGQPILAGAFTSFNGTPCGYITRLNYNSTDGYGTVDTTFNANTGAGADDRPFKLYKLPGSSYLQLLGAFKNYHGTARGGLATLDVDGNLQTRYAGVAANSSTPGTVYALNRVYLPTGPTSGQLDIVIGGDFTGVNGKYKQNLAYLNLDGSLDPARPGFVLEGGPVKSITEEWNGQVLLAGSFARAQGYGCTGLARLNSDGSFDTNFKPVISQANGTSADLHRAHYEDSSTKITISGMFANIADAGHTLQPRSVFALLNDDGTLNPGFNAQISIPEGSNLYANDGGQVGGGNYGVAGYVNHSGNNYGFAAILNSSGVQQTYKLFNGEVMQGTGLSDGRILLVGKFTQVVEDQANRNYIAALKSDWSLDSSFAGAGANGPINAICTEGTDMDGTNGNILIGGSFSSYNGTPINNLARLTRSGGLDTSFKTGNGPNNTVNALYWTRWWGLSFTPTAGKALLGGAFTTYDGTTMPGVARVMASVGSNMAPINSLLLGD